MRKMCQGLLVFTEASCGLQQTGLMFTPWMACKGSRWGVAVAPWKGRLHLPVHSTDAEGVT